MFTFEIIFNFFTIRNSIFLQNVLRKIFITGESIYEIQSYNYYNIIKEQYKCESKFLFLYFKNLTGLNGKL